MIYVLLLCGVFCVGVTLALCWVSVFVGILAVNEFNQPTDLSINQSTNQSTVKKPY